MAKTKALKSTASKYRKSLRQRGERQPDYQSRTKICSVEK